MTPQEIDPDLSVQESPGRHLAVAYCKLRALRATVPAQDLLKEVTILFITSTIVWPQVTSREGTQPHPSTEDWTKDLEQGPINQNNFTFSQSLPSGSFHKALILLSEGRQTENDNHRKLTNLITWTTALSNSVKL